MMMLSEAASMIGARLHGADAMFTAVSKDTRDLRRGDLYVAIKGERFDGHEFVEQAHEAGAAGALVQELQHSGLAQLAVDDSLAALGRLAAGWRDRFAGRMIGLTGSNGKTTVKEMCRHVLVSIAGDEAVLATEGNLNNDIGMPMTLLRLREQHRYAVIEMGANHLGEIDYLTHIATPDVALVNNAGPAHLEGFGSLDNVAKAKAEIYSGLRPEGVAVINLDDNYAPVWLDTCAAFERMTFSTADSTADVYCDLDAGNTVHHAGKQQSLVLQVPGRHNLSNALAATAALLALGLDLDVIITALSRFSNIAGRLNSRQLANGVRVIDDSYNANPMSVRAAIDVLGAEQGQRILVLGDMGELGDEAAALHSDIGRYAKQSGIDRLFACGELSRSTVQGFGDGASHFDDVSQLTTALQPELDSETVVLIKGSRFMQMERVIDMLIHDNEPQQEVN